MPPWFIVFVGLLVAADLVSLLVHGKLSPIRRKQRRSIQQQRGLIIGGTTAPSGDYPFFVHYNTPGCGGSLIAPDIVLTAGHCQLTTVANYGTLYVGRYSDNSPDGAQPFSVIDQSRHPLFDEQVCCGHAGNTLFYGIENDFMLLKLSGQSTKRPIRLNASPARPSNNDQLYVMGFGDINPGAPYVQPKRLKQVTVNYMTNAECIANSIYPGNLLNAASMCASDYREDACAGDSGGPLIVRGANDTDDVQVGIVSWGWECAVQPGVYARVSQGYAWIQKEVCRMSRNPPASFGCTTVSSAARTPRPTPSPTKHPTSSPTRKPTPSPTKTTPRPTTAFPSRRPTSSPTMGPSMAPSTFPTVAPTFSPTAGPTMAPTTFPTAAPTFSPNAGPTMAPTTFPTAAPTSFPTVGPTSGPTNSSIDSPFGNNVSSVGKTQNALAEFPELAPKPIDRQLLPAGMSCVSASASPTVCCSSISNKQGEYQGDNCYPARSAVAFEGGFPCEPSSWIQSNDPNSFDPSFCDSLPTIGVNKSSVESSISVLADRRFLPTGKTCSDIPEARNCCNFLDNRDDQNSPYHGQPCVPMRRTMEDASVCHPANYAATSLPGQAMDCADFSTSVSNSTSTTSAKWDDYLEQFLQTLHQEILEDQLAVTTIVRTDLPAGQTCQRIEDPLICCAAQYVGTDGQEDCVATKPSTLASMGTTTNRSRLATACVPASSSSQIVAPSRSGTGNGTMEAESNTSEVMISAGMSDLWDSSLLSSSSSSAGPSSNIVTFVPSINESKTFHDGASSYCEELIRINLQRRTKLPSAQGGGNCSSLESVRSCCSAIDGQGQPCLPIRTPSQAMMTCASTDWIVSNLPNVSLVECTHPSPFH